MHGQTSIMLLLISFVRATRASPRPTWSREQRGGRSKCCWWWGREGEYIVYLGLEFLNIDIDTVVIDSPSPCRWSPWCWCSASAGGPTLSCLSLEFWDIRRSAHNTIVLFPIQTYEAMNYRWFRWSPCMWRCSRQCWRNSQFCGTLSSTFVWTKVWVN